MTDSPPLGPHELYAYEPPISLWELVKSYVPQHEQQEIKNLLGESLVEQSLELHEEIQTLLEIWRDFRSETENNLMYHRLPEPPAARERLKQEIKFFIDSIREKADNNGCDITNILNKHNKSVLDYVLENKGSELSSGSRPSTSHSSRDGRETPLTITTPDRLCRGSAISKEMDAMKDNLNFLELDSVVQHLRDTLTEEVQSLLKDIDFLQKCLSDEADFRNQPTISREPSLADLRQERSKLEKELLAADLPAALKNINVSSPPRKASMADNSFKMKSRLTPPTTPSATSSGRSVPMRACHQISTQILSLGEQHEQTSHEKSLPDRQHNPVTLSSPTETSPPKSHDRPSRISQHSVNSKLADSKSHVTIRTQLPPNARLVKLGSIPVNSSDVPKHAPSPPSSAKPSSAPRPNSANRFRRMVLDCRDTT